MYPHKKALEALQILETDKLRGILRKKFNLDNFRQYITILLF
jgi:hypothetical protein